MDDDIHEIHIKIRNELERLLSGKQPESIDTQVSDPDLREIITLLNQLGQNLDEMNRLATDLSEGKLDGLLPPRGNYMAGPLKQLHSQLSNLVWSSQQLLSGKVVSKLMYTGELYTAFNRLIDRIVSDSIRGVNDPDDAAASVNSWRYHQILQALNLLRISVLEVDSNRRVVFSNRPAREIFGDIEIIPEVTVDNENVLLNLISSFSCAENAFPIFREIYDEDHKIWYRITADRFLLPNEQQFFLHMIEDVSDWKTNERLLMLSASMDSMTGAYNRKAGLEELEKLLASSNPSESHCIAFIDIDGLKAINDDYGHGEGDFVIKQIARLMLGSVRDSDVICRYGGDEFLILFKRCSEDAANGAVLRMYEKLEVLNSQISKPYVLSFSQGIVTFTAGSGQTVTDLLAVADKRMYKNKMKQRKKPGNP